MSSVVRAIVRDLRRVIMRGDVSSAAAVTARHAADYGRVARHVPQVVVRPGDAADVATVLRYAQSARLGVAVQGAAHSQGAQALADAGILLDMHGFQRQIAIRESTSTAIVGAGATWREVVVAAGTRRLTPPVLTTNWSTTVGGTASLGGIGATSLSRGLQIDHHEWMEVVTPEGGRVRCSGRREAELFEMTLGGLGQFGVITAVGHRLVGVATNRGRFVATYANADALFDVAGQLMLLRDVTALSGSVVSTWSHWRYVLAADVALRGRGASDAVREALGAHDGRVQISVPSESDPEQRSRRQYWARHPRVVAPGLDLILPITASSAFVNAVVASLPLWLRVSTTLTLLFLKRDRLTRPMVMTPNAGLLVVLTIQPVIPVERATEATAWLERTRQRALAGGAKQYVSGWLPTSAVNWRAHFGARWSAVRRAKRRYDPSGTLRSAAVQFAGPLGRAR